MVHITGISTLRACVQRRNLSASGARWRGAVEQSAITVLCKAHSSSASQLRLDSNASPVTLPPDCGLARQQQASRRNFRLSRAKQALGPSQRGADQWLAQALLGPWGWPRPIQKFKSSAASRRSHSEPLRLLLSFLSFILSVIHSTREGHGGYAYRPLSPIARRVGLLPAADGPPPQRIELGPLLPTYRPVIAERILGFVILSLTIAATKT